MGEDVARVTAEASRHAERRRLMRRNFRMSTLDGMLANVAVGMVPPFLPVMAIALGATNSMVGLITALPALVNTIMFMPAARIVECRPRKLNTVVQAAACARIFYLLMALVPALPWAEHRAFILIALTALQAVPTVITAVAWSAMMGDTFPAEERGRLFALRSMAASMVSLAATLIAGFILDRLVYPWGFVVVFMLSYVTSMMSIHFLLNMTEVPEPSCMKEGMSFLDRLRQPFVDPVLGPRFRIFAASALVLHLGINLGGPLYPIYHVRVLGLSNSVIGSFTVASGITGVLSYPMWGAVIRRSGNGIAYAAAGFAFALFPAVYYLSGSVPYLFMLQLIVGIFNAAWVLTLFNLMLEYVSPETRANGIGVFSMLINSTGIVAPFMATFMITHFGIGVPFFVASGIRFIGWLIFLRAAHPERFLKTIATMAASRAHARKLKYLNFLRRISRSKGA